MNPYLLDMTLVRCGAAQPSGVEDPGQSGPLPG
jgi:hypothetical protein